MGISWDDARAKYLGKMKALDVLTSRLKRAIEIEQDGFDGPDREQLEALHKRVQRQLKKLADNEFHIAVVGLEKAGKSTYLNTWLRNDLLPSESERCTYTTTEVHSTADASEQRVRVEYFTRADFEETKRGYEGRCPSHC